MNPNIRITLIIVLIAALLSACSEQDPLVGKWKETWDVGNTQSNVAYQDVYIVTLSNGQYSFSTEGRPHHKFEKISFDGQHLRVTLNNNGFLVTYEMDMATDGQRMTGEATTKDGKYEILWEKIE